MFKTTQVPVLSRDFDISGHKNKNVGYFKCPGVYISRVPHTQNRAPPCSINIPCDC